MIKLLSPPAVLLNKKLLQLSNMIKEHDGETIGIIDQDLEARFCETKDGRVQAVLYNEEDQPIAGLQYDKIRDNCMEFKFGYVKKKFRGNQYAEKLSNAFANYHKEHRAEGQAVYVCMGGYTDAQTLYLAKKLYNTHDVRVWICQTPEEICDETEIQNEDDFENVLNVPKVKSFVLLK